MRDGRIAETREQGQAIGVEIEAFGRTKAGGNFALHHRVDHARKRSILHRARHCLMTESEAEIGQRGMRAIQ